MNLSQGSGGATVTVTLSSAFGELAGTVQDEKGPAAGARVMLRGAPAMGGNADLVIGSRRGGLTYRTKADGTYSFKAIAPGTYKVLVLDESDALTDDGRARRRRFRRGGGDGGGPAQGNGNARS